jgi:hypothetical protein
MDYKDLLDQINTKVQSYDFMELWIPSFDAGKLIVNGSDDSSYYHNFKIVFSGVYVIAGALEWCVPPEKRCIELGTKEEYSKLMYDYTGTADLTVFKFNGDNLLPTFILATSMEFIDRVQLYY